MPMPMPDAQPDHSTPPTSREEEEVEHFERRFEDLVHSETQRLRAARTTACFTIPDPETGVLPGDATVAANEDTRRQINRRATGWFLCSLAGVASGIGGMAAGAGLGPDLGSAGPVLGIATGTAWLIGLGALARSSRLDRRASAFATATKVPQVWVGLDIQRAYHRIVAAPDRLRDAGASESVIQDVESQIGYAQSLVAEEHRLEQAGLGDSRQAGEVREALYDLAARATALTAIVVEQRAEEAALAAHDPLLLKARPAGATLREAVLAVAEERRATRALLSGD